MNSRVIGFIIVAVILGLGGYKYYDYKHPQPKVTTPTEQQTTSTNTTPTETATTPVSSSVNITTDIPVNGTYKGVVEIGASGFNCFVINMDQSKNWELVSKEFGESLAYEGFITTEDVKSGLKKYIGSMATKGVAGRNIHFVMSSGALKNPKTELIAKAIEQMGYVVNRITAQQEAKYGLKALLPKNYINNSFVVDMGSGNTKISWYEGSNIKTLECSGAKYYEDGKKDQDVWNEIAAATSKIPQDKLANCFIIGGVPFQLAKQVRSGEERYTALKGPDYYSAGKDVKLHSGLNIYRAIQETSKTNTFIFDWDANFTVGFLLTLN